MEGITLSMRKFFNKFIRKLIFLLAWLEISNLRFCTRALSDEKLCRCKTVNFERVIYMILPDNYQRIDRIYKNRYRVITALLNDDNTVLSDINEIVFFAENNPDLINYLPKNLKQVPEVSRIIRSRDKALVEKIEKYFTEIARKSFNETLKRHRGMLSNHKPTNRYYRRLAKRKGKTE